jgi:hypothetical protein
MNIAITTSDGMVFNGTDYHDLLKEVNAYEEDLTLKKAKENESKQLADKAFKEIEAIVGQLNAAVKEYRATTGNEVKISGSKGWLKVDRFDNYGDLLYSLMRC